MKRSMSKILLTTTLTSMLLMSACGKKNVVNTSGVSGNSPFTANNPLFSSNPQLAAKANEIKSKIGCLNGNYRLNNDYTFYVQGGNYSQSQIGGQFQQGVLTSGSASELYVGMSVYRDLMFVTKVTNGTSVVGYNVTLSFCSVPNAYPNYPALVSNERSMINFQAPYNIVLNSNTSCGYGLVAAAYYTYIISQRMPNNAYTSDFPVYTTFTNSGCF